MFERKSLEEGKKDGSLSFLPAYYYSPFKEGRKKEEEKALLEAEELEIAEGVAEIGNYTFYGCQKLRRLHFTDSLKRIGGGSFTGCPSLRELYVTMDEGNTSCIRDVVTETFHEIYVTIRFRDTGKYAKLVFPEYYEEGVENTPARILETHFHGSGYRYRQCFRDKKIDYHGYDSLFKVAQVYEKPRILIPMAMGRIQHPYELTEEAADAYKNCMRGLIREAAGFYLERSDWYDALSCLVREVTDSSDEADILLDAASLKGHTEAVSLLMEEKNQKFKSIRKTFVF